MKETRATNPFFHILFWILVIIILSLIFGRSWGSFIEAVYFISMLLPVIMATSYFFNYFLVPRYLLTKKYFFFGLYFFYTLVISLYLQIIVLMFSFIYIANFNMGDMGQYTTDTMVLAIVMYLVVFISSFLLMIRQLAGSQRELRELKEEQEKMKKPFLELVSNRKTVRVPFEDIIYIESLADYIKLNTESGTEIVSKEKISRLEERLPALFLRIHRSFIVNVDKVGAFNYDEVEIGGQVLTIGRSYKKPVLERLKGR